MPGARAASPLLLGAHMSAAGGLDKALLRGQRVGCNCIQIFTRNPRQWDARRVTREQARAFARARSHTGVSLVVGHASYLVNLASRDRTVSRRSRSALAADLRLCDALGLAGVVVHPGSHAGRGVEDGVARIAESMDVVLGRTRGLRARILLETTAGQGNSVGGRFEELARIRERTAAKRRVGFCLDTCHVFAAGYDLRSEEAYEQTWAEFDSVLGLKRLEVIHVNDCKGALAAHLDRHEHIGRGQLGMRAFKLLMADGRLGGIPKILETPKGESDDGRLDRKNLRLLRRLGGAW